MGGDNAPEMVIEGLVLALDRHPNARFLLYGDEARLKPFLDQHGRLRKVSEIRHADDIITNDAKPAQALRGGRQSSMRLAINAVKDGDAVGIISAGNTGALMAMAKFVLKALPGISRPAIATSFPTMRNKTVVLDLGANIECDADNLVQFAVMGEVFARNVLGLDQPSVGILNVGQEDLKGNSAVKVAAAILQDADLPIKFYGFVEGDDLAAGIVDVIVTDGFTGNISLKSIEGTAKMFAHYLRKSLMGSTRGKLGALIAKKALLEFKDSLDPRRYNGAMFLGLNGICVKSHGGTDGLGFSNAIHVAIELIEDGVNEGIKEDFAHVSEALQGGDAPEAEPAPDVQEKSGRAVGA